ncbi:MAG: hypothetical protein ACKN9E_18655 [Microcystaceae cyanobacterium]
MPYIEIKTTQYITSTIAQKIIDKGSVIAILSTGRISQPAKDLFDQAGIEWVENVPEREFMESEAQELG